MNAARAIAVLLAAQVARVELPAGRFAPLFGLDAGQTSLPVAAFGLDVRPVTRAQFAEFLAVAPQWQRGKARPPLVDAAYLEGFDAKAQPGAPVTNVSWFAARAYCAWRGARLPTTLEWEYAAAADETRRDASRDPAFAQRILDWYGQPNRPDDLQRTGSPRNVYGVEALHGLVWEWTEDFNATLVSSDSRKEGEKFSCGDGSTGSSNREDYAAFMRYAMRSSLTPRTSLARLGFRCAWSVKKETP